MYHVAATRNLVPRVRIVHIPHPLPWPWRRLGLLGFTGGVHVQHIQYILMYVCTCWTALQTCPVLPILLILRESLVYPGNGARTHKVTTQQRGLQMVDSTRRLPLDI
jgi:hypothetical protein